MRWFNAEMDAWRLDEVYYLIIDRSSEGAWCSRSYDFVIWAEGREPTFVATFDSFPNAKEAYAALCFHCNAAAIHNLAVLEWQHRIHRYHMIPQRIDAYLRKAKMLKVPTADANLKVLYDHIPELTKESN